MVEYQDRQVRRQWWSLHTARKATECDACGCVVPPKSGFTAGEYWRAKGGSRGVPLLRRVCCTCHFLLGLPDDGWQKAPDGREVMAAISPVRGSDT